jgi:translation initiation factor 1
MNKNNKNISGIVFSTNPDFKIEAELEEIKTLQKKEQPLKILLDKKQRAGKIVTLIKGFIGTDNDLQDLGKKIKTTCGTGGSAKDGEIIIQGDHKIKIHQWLIKNGYSLSKMI